MAVAKYNLPYYNGRGISKNTSNTRPLNTDIYEYIGTIISVNPVTFTVNVASEQGNIDMDILILNQGFSAIERSQSWIHSLRGILYWKYLLSDLINLINKSVIKP